MKRYKNMNEVKAKLSHPFDVMTHATFKNVKTV